MTTDAGLVESQLTRLRLLSADNYEPYWYSDDELNEFYQMENSQLDQAAALAMESRAAALQAGLGGFSSQGITVNAAAMAAGLLNQADRLRQSYRQA